MGIADARNIFEESGGIFFITGLVGLRPVTICKKTFPGYIYVALLLFIYYALWFITVESNLDLYNFMKKFSKATNTRILQLFLNLFFVPFTVLPIVFNASKIRHIYTELVQVDEKLKLLNLRLDYATFVRSEFSRVCEIIVITILFNLLEYYPQIGPETTKFFDLVWIVNTFPQFVNNIAVVSFVIVATKIRRRFEIINEFIPNVTNEEANPSSNLEIVMDNVLKIRLVNRLHEKLINAATSLNEAYGFFLLTSFVAYYLICCSHLYTIALIYGDIMQTVDFIIETLWVIFFLGKYLYVTEACHSLTLQAKLSSRPLQDTWTDVDHHPLKQETDVLARQIESRNLHLTACNFFDIDYPALKKIIVTLAAYLFFVSQFAMSCNVKK